MSILYVPLNGVGDRFCTRYPAKFRALLTVDKNAELPNERRMLSMDTVSASEVAMFEKDLTLLKEFHTNPNPRLKSRRMTGDFSLQRALAFATADNTAQQIRKIQMNAFDGNPTLNIMPYLLFCLEERALFLVLALN